MKFYYNGQLIRTSANHIYTHAVLNEKGKCLGCRSNRQAAEAIITTAIHGHEDGIANEKAAIEALKKGQTMVRFKDGNRYYWYNLKRSTWLGEKALDPSYYESCIISARNCIEQIRATWKVVELEARA